MNYCCLAFYRFHFFFLYLFNVILASTLIIHINSPVKMSIISPLGTFFTNKYAELGSAIVHHCSACSKTFSFGWRGRSTIKQTYFLKAIRMIKNVQKPYTVWCKFLLPYLILHHINWHSQMFNLVWFMVKAPFTWADWYSLFTNL